MASTHSRTIWSSHIVVEAQLSYQLMQMSSAGATQRRLRDVAHFGVFRSAE